MNQQTTYNPTISPPVNMIQPVVPPPQYIPMHQDTFINTSASIPEPMKPFDGLDHSYTLMEQLLIDTLIFIYHTNNNGIHLYNYLKNNFHLKKQLITHK